MKFLPRFKKEYKSNKEAFTFINPFPAFKNWFNSAIEQEIDMEPNAMSLSTVNRYF